MREIFETIRFTAQQCMLYARGEFIAWCAAAVLVAALLLFVLIVVCCALWIGGDRDE